MAMGMLRAVAAVVLGFAFIVCTVSIGTMIATALFIPGGLSSAGSPPASLPPLYLAANLFVSAFGAVLGGWLAARIGTRAPFAHAAGVAALIAILSIAAIVQGASGPQPAWYPFVVGVLGVAGVLAGGALRSAAARAVSGSASNKDL